MKDPKRVLFSGLVAGVVVVLAFWPGCDRDGHGRRSATEPAQGALSGICPCATTGLEPGSGPTTTATAPAVRRVHVFVSGVVQGVGFRAFTQDKARGLKLVGWVRNLADGRVEAVIEGPSAKVATLLEHVRTGPAGSKVEKVEIQDERALGEFSTFEVRR